MRCMLMKNMASPLGELFKNVDFLELDGFFVWRLPGGLFQAIGEGEPPWEGDWRSLEEIAMSLELQKAFEGCYGEHEDFILPRVVVAGQDPFQLGCTRLVEWGEGK